MRGEAHQRMQEEAYHIIWDERPWHDALFPRSLSMAITQWDFPKPRKIYIWYPKDIWDVRLQGNEHYDGQMWSSWMMILQKE